MTQSIQELEREIEETRARLDLTIDRIQDKMSVSGIVDDMMGTVRRSGYSSAMDRALIAVRENPVPILLVVAGLGWLFHRMATERAAPVSRSYLYDRNELGDEPATVIVTDVDRDATLAAAAAADRGGAGTDRFADAGSTTRPTDGFGTGGALPTSGTAFHART